MLQHGKSGVHFLKMNRLISAVSGCRNLSSFSQNYVKVGDYKNSFPASSASQEGSVGEVSVQVDLYFLIIIRTVFLIIIIIILSGGLVHTPGNWRAQSHLERW